ncbi:MAG TPA: isoprenyl transferase [Alphaproteobacteria bacterium]|nr:isoprenyl transferase [Alphaproteobacteria bacterium]
MSAKEGSRIERPTIPRHVAIIMDGNGRWAAKRGLPRAAGHRRGAQAAKETVHAALALGIEYLTLYSFSSENWKRSTEEVSDLMGLLRFTMRREEKDLAERGMRLRVIGDRGPLPSDVKAAIDSFEEKTAANTAMTVVIALSYGSRTEIAQAARFIAEKAARGEIDPGTVDEAMLARHLYTRDIPDPDLLIRTSGEQRVSNFLLWQIAYSELVFTDCFWPDFDREALESAIAEYNRRDRRFGGRRSG